MKSIIEGERALCFWLSQQTEVSLNHPNEKVKQEASDYVSLMTPVVKSLFTDLAMEITRRKLASIISFLALPDSITPPLANLEI